MSNEWRSPEISRVSRPLGQAGFKNVVSNPNATAGAGYGKPIKSKTLKGVPAGKEPRNNPITAPIFVREQEENNKPPNQNGGKMEKIAMLSRGNLDLRIQPCKYNAGSTSTRTITMLALDGEEDAYTEESSGGTGAITIPALTGTTSGGGHGHTIVATYVSYETSTGRIAEGQVTGFSSGSSSDDLSHRHTVGQLPLEMDQHRHSLAAQSTSGEADGAHSHSVTTTASSADLPAHSHSYKKQKFKTVDVEIQDVTLPSLVPSGDPYILVWRDGAFKGTFPDGTETEHDPKDPLVKISINTIESE